jgi:hypothetical protein
MMRRLVEQSAHIRDALKDVTFRSPRDGSPRAQRWIEERLRQAGMVLGHPTVSTGLKPGKRGVYEICVLFWSGYDKHRDREIGIGDALPSRPWLALWYTVIEGTGHNRVNWHRAPLCYISHHVLSRMAQRHGMRTLDDMPIFCNLAVSQLSAPCASSASPASDCGRERISSVVTEPSSNVCTRGAFDTGSML